MSNEQDNLVNNYWVDFEYTTVHKGSRFVGRKGQLDISTDATIEDAWKDIETIEKMCVDAILKEKPKWNIFMIEVKNIYQAKSANHE